MYENSSCSACLPTLAVSNFYFFLYILIDMLHYLIKVSIYISLMANEVECLFMCLIDFCISFFVMCSNTSYLKNLVIFILFNFEKSLHSLDKCSLLNMWFANTFSQSVPCFSFLSVFHRVNVLNSELVQCIIFFYYISELLLILCFCHRKILVNNFLLFLCENFIVLHLYLDLRSILS